METGQHGHSPTQQLSSGSCVQLRGRCQWQHLAFCLQGGRYHRLTLLAIYRIFFYPFLRLLEESYNPVIIFLV